MDICCNVFFKSTSKTTVGVGKNESFKDRYAFLHSPGRAGSSWATVLHPVQVSQQSMVVQNIRGSGNPFSFLILFSSLKKAKKKKKSSTITPSFNLTASNSSIRDASEQLQLLPADVPPDHQQGITQSESSFQKQFKQGKEDWKMKWPRFAGELKNIINGVGKGKKMEQKNNQKKKKANKMKKQNPTK